MLRHVEHAAPYAARRGPFGALAARVLLLALPLALVACRGGTPRAPEDLPRGTFPGSTAPMTDREASRAPAPTPLSDATPPPSTDSGDEGINVPGGSSAARSNWRPREVESDDPTDSGETADVDDSSGDGDAEDTGDADAEDSGDVDDADDADDFDVDAEDTGDADDALDESPVADE